MTVLVIDCAISTVMMFDSTVMTLRRCRRCPCFMTALCSMTALTASTPRLRYHVDCAITAQSFALICGRRQSQLARWDVTLTALSMRLAQS